MIDGKLYPGEVVAWQARYSASDPPYWRSGAVNTLYPTTDDEVRVRDSLGNMQLISRKELFRFPFPEIPVPAEEPPLSERFKVGDFVVWSDPVECAGRVERVSEYAVLVYLYKSGVSRTFSEGEFHRIEFRKCDPVAECRFRHYSVPLSVVGEILFSPPGKLFEVWVEAGDRRELPDDVVFVRAFADEPVCKSITVRLAHPTFAVCGVGCLTPYGGILTIKGGK